MDLLRRIMPLLAQPLIDYFDLTYVSGAVTTGNGTRRPIFPPSVWNIHDVTVNNADRTNDFTEAWNRALRHCSVKTIHNFYLLLLLSSGWPPADSDLTWIRPN